MLYSIFFCFFLFFFFSSRRRHTRCALVTGVQTCALPIYLLIAVSYHPYAEETLQSVAAAVDSGCKVLAISDSLVSPVAKPATLVLQVREAEIRKFRSLSASMCLADRKSTRLNSSH